MGMVVRMGGEEIFSGGCFRLDADKEMRLSGYLMGRALETKRVPWPQHERTVDIVVASMGDQRPWRCWDPTFPTTTSGKTLIIARRRRCARRKP